MTNQGPSTSFFQLLDLIKDHGLINSKDFIAYALPLLAGAKEIHDNKKVMNIQSPNDIIYLDSKVQIISQPIEYKYASQRLFTKPAEHRVLEFENSIRSNIDLADSTTEYSLTILQEAEEPITKPVYLVGYTSWEAKLGHCDPLTDIFTLGLYLASIAYGLQFNNKDDFEHFIANRKSLYFLNRELHPTIHNVIYELTEVYREDRTRSIEEAYIKLKNYRDYNPENYIDLTTSEGFRKLDVSKRDAWILSKLKSRLFDISRRNKLLYFADKKNFLNLSVNSVPLLLDHNNIREDDIIFWNDRIKKKLISSKKLTLNDYLDVKSNRFIAPTINQIRLTARKNKNEFGFNTMRIIVAFLNWYNFKDNADEMITSPLLLLPAEVVKKKGINDSFDLIVEDTEAIVNPVLSYYLNDLYGITLPDFVDLSTTSIEELISLIEQQIAQGNSGITLEWRKKPRIQLIHSIAKKNFNLNNQNLRNRSRGLHLKSFNYSYTDGDFKPLGLQIFESRIQAKNNALEYIINEDLRPDESLAVSEKVRTMYTTKDEGDVNPTIWQIDTCNTTIGNFNYRKMSLVRDYNHILNESISNEVFETLFSEIPKKSDVDLDSSNHLTSSYPIISSDPTQSSAINYSRTNESYIIQGPPGTGKSQTITNLIADYVARGKKVLFVCEKRAALDVVYHRLKTKSLDELCCLVHDSQADKKAFIMDLKATYEDFLKNKYSVDKITSKRNQVISIINAELERLNTYHKAMNSGATPPFQLFEILLSHKEGKTLLPARETYALPTYDEWEANNQWIEEWYSSMKMNGLGEYLADYPFSNTQTEILNSPNAKVRIQNVIDKATDAFDQFSEMIDNLDSTIDSPSLNDWENQFELARKIQGIVSKGKLDIFNDRSQTANEFQQEIETIQNEELKLGNAQEKNSHWNTKFTEQDLEIAINNWKAYSSNIFRFLSPTYYKLKRTIKENYDFSAHKITPEVNDVLTNLKSEFDLQNQLEQYKNAFIQKYGLSNYENDCDWINKTKTSNNPHLTEWIKNDQEDLIRLLHSNYDSFIPLLKELKQIFGENLHFTIEQFEEVLSKSTKALSTLTAFTPFVQQLSSTSEAFRKCISEKKWTRSDIAFHLASKSLVDIYELEHQFSEMDEDAITISIKRINSLLDHYYELNVESIQASVRSKFNELIKVTESTASQLTNDGKKLKKKYLNSRRILENEFGKSMRYKSIRDLASSDAYDIMTALKPVWLMSPLSVSDTMPIDTSLFDVVIFDEASQITVEEGVPSLFRSKQTIIVGDEMQMPPTNFFNAINVQDDEDEELEEKIGISLDADSILNQGARKLTSVMLGWHYRSRHESLISFSNAAFYQRSLMTIPDATIQKDALDTIPPILDVTAPISIDEVLSRSISFHHIENGIYDKRRNKDEAAYIANLVRELLLSKSNKSIGIVAFSQEQQNEIEETLERYADNDPKFDALLEKEYQRIDEDQFNGLFVKNLENVQGDERDIIIMSVCYGYNENGRMLMNFGPINRRGGEKRLNVIFSRAKSHMVVVSSITAIEIKNDYNEGANYFKRFLSYAKYISDGQLNEANIILDGLNLTKNHSKYESHHIVSNQLREALISKGHSIEMAVGQSYFKCDLAIKGSDSNQYTLGILIDHQENYDNTNVLEQYCQRPEILRAFGWKIAMVYTKDWFEKPERVLERIDQILNDAPEKEEALETILPIISEEVTTDSSQVVELIPEESPATEEIIKEESLLRDNHLDFERYEFSSGTSNKYWQIACDATKVIVQYGRIGNNPQENIKEFTSLEKALEEKDKMIAKKVAKGYVKKE